MPYEEPVGVPQDRPGAEAPDPTRSRAFTRRTLLHTGLVVGAAAATLSVAEPAWATGNLHAQIPIATNGTTKYHIVIGEEEGAVVQQAASELADYLGQITSATFTVVTATDWSGHGPVIALGKQNWLASSLSIDYGALSDDGFTLRKIGDSFLIAGASTRGTLYGAYWVLDRLCGVRWWASDVTFVPTKPTLKWDATQAVGNHVPRFRFRCIYMGDAYDAAYRQHNMLNGLRDTLWNAPRSAGIDTWSQYWPEDDAGGTIFDSVVTDQSLWYGGQLLMMDPATRTDAANSLTELVQARIDRGEGASSSFYQEDGPWTPDPDSQAFADAHGGALSAPLVDMLNDVAQRVETAIPGARLETQAYLWGQEPPTGMTVRDNVVITFAPVSADFGKSLFSDGNEPIWQDIKGWSKIAKNIVLWDYTSGYSGSILPFPDWWATGDGIKQMATLPSVQGYFGEGTGLDTFGTPFSQLVTWVDARLLWDPTLDVNGLITEFVQGYYGAAATPVLQYMQLMRQSLINTATSLSIWETPTAGNFTFDTMRQADALMEQAQGAVQGDSDLLKRVQTIRQGIDYIILIRVADFQAAAVAEGVTWDPDTANRLARLQTEVDASGLTWYANGVGPDDVVHNARLASTPTTPPQTVAGLPSSDWVDFQEPAMRLAAPDAIVIDDERASNGSTVKMTGSVITWATQLTLNSLPTTDTWKMYATIACDAAPAGTDPSTVVIEGGVYLPSDGSQSTTFQYTVDDLADGAYHELELNITTQYDGTSAGYIYFTGVPPTNAPYIYIDRIFAVKA